MRSIVRIPYALLAAVMLCVLAGAVPVRAQALPGGYATHTEFVIGTWKWDRQEPRQTVVMRFESVGKFSFHNQTTGLQHFGTFTTTGPQLDLQITRSCEENGARCSDRSPPLVLNYPFNPASAVVFQSGDERWERQGK